jgi:hypothetical protein
VHNFVAQAEQNRGLFMWVILVRLIVEFRGLTMSFRGLTSAALCVAVLTFFAASNANSAGRGAVPSAIAKACSAKADTEKLAGKERRKFRRECIREAKRAKKSKK